MESWEETERIKTSMEVILDIEAEASRNICAKEGLMELLQLLADSQVGGHGSIRGLGGASAVLPSGGGCAT
jgi:hypothetical protein